MRKSESDSGDKLAVELWEHSTHCRSRAHCVRCRQLHEGRLWRFSLTKAFRLPGGDVDFACPWGVPWYYKRWVRPPGDALATVLRWFGIREGTGCDCNRRRHLMNGWGWGGCLVRSPVIAWWLATSVALRGWSFLGFSRSTSDDRSQADGRSPNLPR